MRCNHALAVLTVWALIGAAAMAQPPSEETHSEETAGDETRRADDEQPLEVLVTPEVNAPTVEQLLAREAMLNDGGLISLRDWIASHYMTDPERAPETALQAAVQTGAVGCLLAHGAACADDPLRPTSESVRLIQLGARYTGLSLADAYATFGLTAEGDRVGGVHGGVLRSARAPTGLIGDDLGLGVDRMLLARRFQVAQADAGLGQAYHPGMGGYNPVFGLIWSYETLKDALPALADDTAEIAPQ